MIRSAIAVLALSTAIASAQERAPSVAANPVALPSALSAPVFSSQSSGPAIGFTLRGGVESRPDYFGSNDNEAAPALGGSLNYLRLGGFTFGDPDPLFRPQGFGINGSFRYINKRDSSDHSELDGLDDVDTSFELGGGLRYATADYEVFGNVRYGVIGHHAWIGELGANAYLRPTENLTLRLGPRALFGSRSYAQTYFGVSDPEAARSDFDAYDAGGGLISIGAELGAGYQITDRWGVDAVLAYDDLRRSAADSPISEDDSSVTASIGVVRRFTLGF